MAGMEINYDSPDLVKFYKAVKSVDVEAQKALRKRLTATVKPIVQEVRQAALAIPSTHGDSQSGSTMGLRAGIAAATQSKVNPANSKKGFSIRIRVSGSTFAAKTGKYRKLPRYVEGLSKRPWRHPVFATKGTTGGTWSGAWVTQSKHPFLLSTVLPHRKEIEEEVSKAFIDAMLETKLIK